ncbi:prolyl oligopeptidase family serine peptidase [Vibrio coralliilyticus]|uniref:prolyl oligopeptidase family serine peptidase n=1 Tax=Vibrio coralliilyticus TaxID=190893 RepID=UPI0006CD813E|nr:prolyl oligopeptidase family serine peptidase [Vibrio coralliilyticus]AXN34562.1 S9 family peptidase [Vibrio coralliilyticus]KPH24850.1 protease [Vibrio coralliilyticus]
MKFMNVALVSMFMSTSVTAAVEDFNWLRDDSRSNYEVKDYLESQNVKSKNYLSKLTSLQNKLIDEWNQNVPQKAQAPWSIRGELEFTLQSHDGARKIVTRERGTQTQRMLLDVESRAEQHDYYHLAAWSVSPDGQRIALAEDTVGNEYYRVVVVDLQTKHELKVATRSDSTILWGTNNNTLFTIEKTEDAARPAKLIENDLKTGKTKLRLKETQSDWLLSAYTASDRGYAIIQVNNETSTEQRVLDLGSGSLSEPIHSRAVEKEYYADIANDHLFINSNHEGEFSLYQARLSQPDRDKWTVIHRPESGVHLQNFYLFSSGIAVIEQKDGRKILITKDYSGSTMLRQPLTAEGNVGWVSRVGDFSSNVLRIRSMSMIQPPKWEELNVKEGKRILLSKDQYPNYVQSEYQTEQIMVSSGGVKVPVTLAFKTSLLNSSSPVVLYGYGAYGFTMKPYFMPQIVSLMDKGFIYAIAHVRGGGYFGESWHNDGKGIRKANGIRDFANAAKAMRDFRNGLRKVAAIGSSAGGTLVAAAINLNPEYFSAASINVPFVDVVASMSDESLPLTAQQYQEWGNPNVPAQLSMMKKYDPVTNIGAKAYPPILARVGWHDSRVPYWEGAKYISLISEKSRQKGPYLLVTDFQSGHATDRRKAVQQQAMDYAFLIKQIKESN